MTDTALPDPGFYLDPSNMWSRQLAGLGSFGLRALAPNLASLVMGELPPPLKNLPDAPGKAPSTGDPRVAGAMAEAANIAVNFLPLLPGAGVAADIRRFIPGLISRVVPEAEALASKSPMMYNPPPKPARAFTEDYSDVPPIEPPSGRLSRDIEGRPLTARYVVGRTMAGGADEALPASKFDALTAATTGRPPQTVPPRETDFGRTLLSLDGRPIGIELNADMRPDKAVMVHAHELAHAIDQLAGEIPAARLGKELRSVYNTLNNPQRTRAGLDAVPWAKPITPQAHGYRGEEIPREYMVEAIRAYLTDPNYLKTVAPKTAARIRESVNSNPALSKIIQFNTIAGLMGLDAAPEVAGESLPTTQKP